MPWFSNTAEYALRALGHLSERDEQGRAAAGQDAPAEAILGRDLAKLANVPANYLSKILLTLNRAGVVEATRGLGGGYRLKRPATEVTLVEVIQLFDSPEDDTACFLGGGRKCSAENPCPAHEHWRLVRESYLDFIRRTTLADIVRPDPERELPPGS